jgi:uncharacterized membrane protein
MDNVKAAWEALQNINLFCLMLGGILLLAGMITKIFPPKKINMVYGYRTTRSMKNQANWDYAQQIAPREMLRAGWLVLAFSLSGLVFPSTTGVQTITGLILMTIIFIIMVRRTEKALKHFENSAHEK